uniref:Uncharacterized protein n=2 Tax=Anoplophora glabripennis TaxID=217634 RepID=V5H2U9_ANOGL
MESENSDDELEKDVVLKMDKTKSSVLNENEKRGTKATKSKTKDTSNKAPYVFENAAFEGSLQSKRGSTATSSRAPSVQSLEIVREQYCCCAKRTKCERILLTMVIVLFIIVVVLVVVIVIVAKQDDIRQLTQAIRSLR